MSTPLHSKLSYAWKRLTHQDAIYSHTFLKSIKRVRRKDLYISMWIQAEKIKEAHDRFIINIHSFSESGRHTIQRHPGEHSRATTLKLIAQWETSLLQNSNGNKINLCEKSHFKRSLQTELIIDGVNKPHSVIKPEKKELAAAMKSLRRDMKKLGID